MEKFKERIIKKLLGSARWIGVNPFVDTMVCSNCDYNIIDKELATPFCPFCGKPMLNYEELVGIENDDNEV